MTPTQQLIAKLRECETTMTKGEWFSDGLKVENAHHDIALCDPTPPHLRANEDARLNAHGIATLKNSNPTVIAMLERVMELRAELLLDSSISAATTRQLLKFDADLDALAREALKEKP